ncbi:MAG: ferritin-like domain-containing protein [Chloroflexia bacterium]
MSEILPRLLQAASDEHAAVIQYLRHAYALGEGEVACEIEGIARDEMRHFWMLSRWIVQLGGQPTLERGFVDLAGTTPPEWMERDVAAEDRAIAYYRETIALTTDAALRDDLARILADEEHHRGKFAHLSEKLAAPPEAVPQAGGEAATAPPSSEFEALDWGVRHEYAAILQYLFHRFLIPDEEAAEQLELQAINEMQHMGWLAEELHSLGGEMPLEHHPVERAVQAQEMLQADIRLEHDTAAMYEKFERQIEDPGLKDLLQYIRGHELYHEALFSRLLESSKALSPTGWTIGSLKENPDKG